MVQKNRFLLADFIVYQNFKTFMVLIIKITNKKNLDESKDKVIL